jgi:hypothetical protein
MARVRVLVVAMLATLCTLSVAAKQKNSFKRDAWISDYLQLRQHVSKIYANLADKVQTGEVDPFRLNQGTLTELKGATSDKEALRALLRFIGSFNDGHFRAGNFKQIISKYIPFKTVYPVKLDLSAGKPVVKIVSDPKCKIPNGSELVSLNNEPVEEAIERYKSFASEGDETLRRTRALENIASGGFAPEPELVLDAKVGDRTERCKLLAKHERWPSEEQADSKKIELTSATSADAACKAMGILARDAEFAFQLDKLKGFSRISNQSYRAGIWKEPGSPPIGFVRFHAFGEYGYLPICKEEWDRFKSSLHATCDLECQRQFQYQRMIPRLLKDAEELVSEFNRRGVKTLVLDTTGNGGGGDWSDALARMLSPKSKMNCQTARRIKHPKSVESYQSILVEVESDLKSHSLSESDKAILQKAREELKVLAQQASETCDLKGYWEKPGFKPTCSLLTDASEYACGFFPYLPPGSLANASAKQALFKSLDHEYKESLFNGAILIVMDRYTSSSAEYFVAMLRDNGVAKVVGEHSNSTGCGYINGGVPVTLSHSGLEVNMSTCVRFRQDGRNEVFGIIPDVEIPWVGDSPEEATRRLIEVAKGLSKN